MSRFRTRLSSRKIKSGRGRFSSPWLVPRGGGVANEKLPVSTAQQETKQQHTQQQQQHHRHVMEPHQQHLQHEMENSETQQVVPLSSLPLIDTTSISLALRLTCETNRRLHHGTRIDGSSNRKAPAAAKAETASEHTQHSLNHEQQILPASSSPPPVVRSVSDVELIEERRKEELTVFHSTKTWEPLSNAKLGNYTTDIQHTGRGIMRWGPDLQTYLGTLLSAIGLEEKDASSMSDNKQLSPMEDETQLILTLTMLYLDKSTSFATPLNIDPSTGQPWTPPCPHLVPRTIHRMLLIATTIAAKYIRGDVKASNKLREAANALTGQGYAISSNEMEAMETWMLHALGASAGTHQNAHSHEMSWQISQEEMGTFIRKWGGTFYPQRLVAHDETRMKQIERFWNGQAAVFGGNNQHGHGNYWPNDHGGSDQHPPATLQYDSMDQPTSSHDGQDQHWSPEQQQQHSHNHQAQHQYYQSNSESF